MAVPPSKSYHNEITIASRPRVQIWVLCRRPKRQRGMPPHALLPRRALACGSPMAHLGIRRQVGECACDGLAALTRGAGFPFSPRPEGRSHHEAFTHFLRLPPAVLAASPARAVDMSIVSGDTGNGLKVLRDILDQYREEKRQQGHHRSDADLDDRPVRPVQAVAGRPQHRHRRLPDRRHLGAAARQPARRPDRGDQGRRRRTISRRSSSRRPSTASWSRCRYSPTRRRSTTARTCSTNTAPSCRPPGPSWPTPPSWSWTRSARPATRTCGASSSRATPMRG